MKQIALALFLTSLSALASEVTYSHAYVIVGVEDETKKDTCNVGIPVNQDKDKLEHEFRRLPGYKFKDAKAIFKSFCNEMEISHRHLFYSCYEQDPYLSLHMVPTGQTIATYYKDAALVYEGPGEIGENTTIGPIYSCQ